MLERYNVRDLFSMAKSRAYPLRIRKLTNLAKLEA
jgi:hypothetical protein